MLKSRLFGAVGIVAIVGGVAAVVSAQAPAAPLPSFEVASVKANKFSGPLFGGVPDAPNRFTAKRVTLAQLVGTAYRVRDTQVLNGPSWSRSDYFDVIAATAAAASRADKLLMLQRLLRERFSLELHHETRELPALDLTVARKDGRLGPRILPASDEDTDCSMRGIPKPIFPSGPPVANCGMLVSTTSMFLRGKTIDQLAQILEDWGAGPIIVNRTGLIESFNVALDWGGDDQTDRASLFITPLLDQLGLRLASTKEPLDVLVIDHVEHPTED
jgi:uncharacterized protein (TIGR03435 family)